MNDWDIPVLDMDLQATGLPQPVLKWGVPRTTPCEGGTWHFYTHDYRFTAMIGRPWQVPRTGCATAVEVNFTIEPTTPRAVAIERVYQKRRLSFLWQQHGVRIVVDLNASAGNRHDDLNLIGVPRGWGAYATRAHRGVFFGQIEHEHDLALRHWAAGNTLPVWAVFGGGKKVKAACLARGWTWVPEWMDRVKRRRIAEVPDG